MLTTGNQLKAARFLAGLDQQDIASRAGVNVNTIRNMEASGAGPIAGRAASVHAVQRVLEDAGVLFLSAGDTTPGGPGVRLKARQGDFEPIGLGVAIDRHEDQIGLAGNEGKHP